MKFRFMFGIFTCLVACGSPETKVSYSKGEQWEREYRHVDSQELKSDLQQVSETDAGNAMAMLQEEEVDLRVTWKNANLTYFNSYPAPGSAECLEYNGCQWAGMFAALSNKKSLDWVKSHNVIAVHSRHFNKYRLKTFRIRSGSSSIDAKVYDMCADSDCNGCCTNNARETGFLIDMEKYTKNRFGKSSGTVEWRCLDC